MRGFFCETIAGNQLPVSCTDQLEDAKTGYENRCMTPSRLIEQVGTPIPPHKD